MSQTTPVSDSAPKIISGGDHLPKITSPDLRRVTRLNSSTSSPDLATFRQENISPITSPKFGRFQQNYNTTTSTSKLARLQNETHSTITSISGGHLQQDTISSVSSAKLGHEFSSPTSTPRLGRFKPEHHRSVQQLAEKLSEIQPLKIFPATWEKLSTSEKFCHWLKIFSEISNIHGMKWHLYVEKVPIKIMCISFIFIIIFAMPAILIHEAVHFFDPGSINTAVVLGREDKMKYPNVTVCFAKFFDQHLLEDQGISNEMANYLTMALDPNAANIYELMKEQIENYEEKMTELQDELDEILVSRNISIVELFHKIAIRCEKFISLCDIHGEYLFSTPGISPEKKCCGAFFNPVPIFVNTGTCFTSYKEIWEVWPFTFSFIKIWLNVQSKTSPEFELMFKGSDAVERRGAFYAINDEDHPATKLMQSPHKISKGSAAQISLSTSKVDRSQLGPNHCFSRDENVQLHYQVPYTKRNCEVLDSTDFLTHCSLAPFYGITPTLEEEALGPCEPKDMLSFSLSYDLMLNSNVTIPENPCLPFCLQTDYLTKVSEGIIDNRAIDVYNSLSKTNILGDPKDVIILQFHFNSFEQETQVLFQEDFFTFLSKIGGWLSVVIGASVIAFFELMYLFATLLVTYFEKTTQTTKF